MKNIRTILLLSATCLTIIGAETSFASLNGASLPSYTGSSATSTSICNTVTLSPKSNQKSHTHLVAESPSPHLSSSNWPQTLSEHRDLSAPISLPVTDARGGSPLKRRPFASVCFITDAGNCAGLENDEGWNFDDEDRCQEEGYDCTPCSGGSEAVDICPYSANCHQSCKITCDSAYNKSCDGYDQQGKGDSCNGLYKECCNLCSDYPYTDSNLPTGYVKGSSCNSCSGTKYKASCDTAYQYRCVDDGYDGNANLNGGSGTACDGRYKACNCKSGYNWNASTGTCDISCDTAYKFDCIKSSSTHISGGDGSACNGKYQRCTCTSPYTWSSNACTCPTTYKYACTGTGYSKGSGTACNGKYTKCTCASGYEWKNGTCTKTCDTSYKYTCTNLNETGGSGDSCNNKYKSCTCKSGYIWKNGACIKDCTGCNIGCIYFSDKTCSSIKESGKTPLGVVAYKNGSNMQIIALNSTRTGKDWSTENVPLFNIKLSLFYTEEKAQTDFDSCGNTAAIIAAGNSSTFPGVYAAYNYRPSGTPSGQNWCLPAAGVLASIRDNITIINDALKTAGGATMGKEGTSLNWYWSSTLQDHNNMSIGGLRLVWTYATNALDDSQFNKLYSSIANSNSTSSTDENFKFRSVLDISDCPSSYKYTCSGTNQTGGYGSSCGGKYTSCTCKTGYTWNSNTGTCEIDCDSSYKYTCTGSHQTGGSGTACNGKYKKCTCEYGYTWEGYYGTCEKACGPEYQYTCPTYNGIITGGVGSPCDNKYTACTCTSGYTWDSNSGDCVANKTCDSSYKYTCTGSHQIGGSGSSCDGKYKSCQCDYGYTWNSIYGTCESSYSGPCSGKSDGANGNYYCCNNKVTGVKTSSMDFYVAMKDIGIIDWQSAMNQCQSYIFCSNVKGSFPSREQLLSIYQNKSQINTSLSTNGGTRMTELSYWSSTSEGYGTSHHSAYVVDISNGNVTVQWADGNYNYTRAILTSSSGGNTCDSSYKYTCTYSTLTHITGGSGPECEGKYTACQCVSGYVWDYILGKCKAIQSCDSSYKYQCVYDYYTKIAGGVGDICDGKYTECRCWAGYTWNPSTGTCGKNTSTCSSEYKYSCTYSDSSKIYGGSGNPCNGKYTACKCMSGYEWSYGTCIPTSSGSSSSSGGDNGKVTACFTYQSNDIILFNGQYSSFGGGNRTNWTAGCHTHPNAVLCLDSMAVANTNKNYTIIVYDDQGKEIDRASQKCADHYPADDPVYKGWYNCDFSIGPCVSSSDLTNPSASAKIVVQ